MGHAADAAVADGNQEVFGGYGRQAQNAVGGFGDVDIARVKRFFRRPHGFVAARGFGRFAEQDVQRQIDRIVGEQIVAYFQMAVVGRRADYGKRAAFAFADGAEGLQIFFQDGQHITFLRFVAPNLQWAEAVFFQRHFAQLEYRAASGIVDEFGEGVGQAARADVVDGDNRVLIAELPAAVDDFLRATFDFGVAALYGVEVQRRIVRAGIHGRSRATA